jgi:hypothetical protein
MQFGADQDQTELVAESADISLLVRREAVSNGKNNAKRKGRRVVGKRTRRSRCRRHRRSGASLMRGENSEPIPSRSVGENKPQYPAVKSTRIRHGANGPVLAE